MVVVVVVVVVAPAEVGGDGINKYMALAWKVLAGTLSLSCRKLL